MSQAGGARPGAGAESAWSRGVSLPCVAAGARIRAFTCGREGAVCVVSGGAQETGELRGAESQAGVTRDQDQEEGGVAVHVHSVLGRWRRSIRCGQDACMALNANESDTYR